MKRIFLLLISFSALFLTGCDYLAKKDLTIMDANTLISESIDLIDNADSFSLKEQFNLKFKDEFNRNSYLDMLLTVKADVINEMIMIDYFLNGTGVRENSVSYIASCDDNLFLFYYENDKLYKRAVSLNEFYADYDESGNLFDMLESLKLGETKITDAFYNGKSYSGLSYSMSIKELDESTEFFKDFFRGIDLKYTNKMDDKNIEIQVLFDSELRELKWVIFDFKEFLNQNALMEINGEFTKCRYAISIGDINNIHFDKKMLNEAIQR